jgi:exodeoxyribonuclease VII small subunit
MARLEEIVAELQRQDIPLEKAFDLWEEGRKLHAHCTAILDRLKKRLEESTVPKEEEDGDTSEEDWDGSEEDWEESDEDADEA